MVFNVTFVNISAMPWRSVLSVEETGVLGENHRPAVGVLSKPRYELELNTQQL
jgi:hypothetical protein